MASFGKRFPLLPVGLAILAIVVASGCTSGPPASPPATEPTVETVNPPATTPADSTVAEEPPPIRVQISDEERLKLLAQLTTDLDIAKARASSRPDSATLSAEERQRWDTLDQYIESAMASWEAGDIRAASDLAQKAHLLADEIGPR